MHTLETTTKAPQKTTRVLLFYKYVKISDTAALKLEQEALCASLQLVGRIIVSQEGMNGTVEGSAAACEAYMKAARAHPLFSTMGFKQSDGTGTTFPKLSVKIRSEIVSANFGKKDIDPNVVTGKYLTAEELHEWIRSDREFYIVDMRNDYEHRVGFFKNSVLPPLKNFRDLPKVLPKLRHLKKKTVVTVCTGGVRCEKASGFLVTHGFKDVYQLKDGIHTYMEKYPNEDFVGKLYVFDGRVTMGFNTDAPEHLVVSQCDKCGETSDHYVDCAYIHCKNIRHFICCESCLDDQGRGYCDEVCQEKDSVLQNMTAV